jgi:hypothetical protein
MPPSEVDALRQAIRDMHGCESKWVESVPITETFGDETVWQGTVEVFDLIDHPTATRCYAWSHEVERSDRRRYVTVLHTGPFGSPRTAVQAAIIREHQEGG